MLPTSEQDPTVEGVNAIDFKGAMWEVIDNTLTVLKMEDTAALAAEKVNSGEQVVVAFDKTLNAALERHEKKLLDADLERHMEQYRIDFPNADAAQIESAIAERKAFQVSPEGRQQIRPDFTLRTLMRDYLERQTKYKVHRRFQEEYEKETKTGKKVKRKRWVDTYEYITIPIESMPDGAKDAYNAAMKAIDNSGFENISASPIDELKRILSEKTRVAGQPINVVEITGRQKLIEYVDGKPFFSTRPKAEMGANGKSNSVRKFNDGEAQVIVMNTAAAEGVSMHSSVTFKNQNKRHMIIAQFPKQIEKAIQILGRVNRTGQVVDPEYTIIMSDMPADIRPVSIFLNRMASLNANVTASTEGEAELLGEIPDVMNQVGSEVLYSLMKKYQSEGMDLFEALGIKDPMEKNKNKDDEDGGAADLYSEAFIAKVTGRFPMLPEGVQRSIWNTLTADYEATIKALDATGTNPLMAKTVDLQAKTKSKEVVEKGQGLGAFGEDVVIEKVSALNDSVTLSANQIVSRIKKSLKNHLSQDQKSRSYDISNRDIELTDAGQAFAQETINNLYESVDQYMESQKEEQGLSREEMDDLRRELEVRAVSVAKMLEFNAGTVVVLETIVEDKDSGIKSSEEVIGVVLGHKVTNKAKDPTALSNFGVNVAVLDSRKEITIPYSMMHKESSKKSKGTGYRISPAYGPQNSLGKVLENFKKLSESFREDRYIATGNTLSAFNMFAGEYALKEKEFRGKIVFYSDDKGNRKAGVLLPKGFDPESWKRARPIQVKNIDQLKRILATKGAYGNTAVTDFKREFRISLTDSGSLYITLDTKSKLKKYLLKNVALKEAMGNKGFEEKGATFDLRVDKENVDATLAELLKSVDLFVYGSAKQIIEPKSGPVDVKAESKENLSMLLEKNKKKSEDSVRSSKKGVGRRSSQKADDYGTKEDAARSYINAANEVFELEMTERTTGPRQIDVFTNEVTESEFRDLKVAPTSEEEQMSSADLINTLRMIFKVPTWVHNKGIVGPKEMTAGYFSSSPMYEGGEDAVTMQKIRAHNVAAFIHEIAHALDKRHSMINQTKIGKSKREDPGIFPEDYVVKNGKNKGKIVNLSVSLRSLDYYVTRFRSTEPDQYGWDPDHGRNFEGWAEFLRWYMTSDNMVDSNGDYISGLKATHPELVEWFETEYLPSNPELAKQLSKAKGYINKYMDQSLITMMTGSIGEPAKRTLDVGQLIEDKIESVKFKAKQRFIDDAVILDIADEILENAAEEKGYTLKEIFSMIRFTENDQADGAMKTGVKHPLTGELIRFSSISQSNPTGIYDFINKRLSSKEDYDEAMVFAWARHVLWVKEDAPKGAFQDQYAMGMTAKQARAILMYYKADPDKYRYFTEIAEEISRYGGDILDLKVETGQMDPLERQRINALYRKNGENYFPMQRVKNEVGNGLDFDTSPSAKAATSSKGLKKRTRFGSAEAPEDPLVSLQTQLVHAYNEARKHIMIRELMDRTGEVTAQDGYGGLVHTEDPSTIIKSIDFESSIKQLEERGVITEDFAAALKTFVKMIDLGFSDKYSEKKYKEVYKEFESMMINRQDGFKVMFNADPNDPDGYRLALQKNYQRGITPDVEGILSQYMTLLVENPSTNSVITYDEYGKRQAIRIQKDLYDLIIKDKDYTRGIIGLSLVAALQGFFRRTSVTGNLGFGLQELGTAYQGSIPKTSEISGVKNILANPIKEMLGGFLPFARDWGEEWRGGEDPNKKRDRSSFDVLYNELGGSSFQAGAVGLEPLRFQSRKRATKGLVRAGGRFKKKALSDIPNLYRGVKDKVAFADYQTQALIAYSDRASRIANMKAYMERLGYEDMKNGNWRSPDGTITRKLPAEVRIRAAQAIRSANIDYKVAGSWTRAAGKYLIFWPAAISGTVQPLKQQAAGAKLASQRVLEMFGYNPETKKFNGDRKNPFKSRPSSRKASSGLKRRIWNRSANQKIAVETFDGSAVVRRTSNVLTGGGIKVEYTSVDGKTDTFSSTFPQQAKKWLDEKIDDDFKKHGAPKTKKEKEAERAVVFAMANVAMGLVWALLNSERDDYLNDREMTEDYITMGYGGTTILKQRKDRDYKVFFNLGESMADELITAYSSESIGRNNVGAVLLDDIKTKGYGFFPSGGGIVSGAREVFSNKDYFGRPIRSRSIDMLGASPSFQFDSRTTDLAVSTGYFTGKLGDAGAPVFVDHMIDSLFAGNYKPTARLLPGGTPASWKDLPVVSAMAPMNIPSQPLYDMYELKDQMDSSLADDRQRIKLDPDWIQRNRDIYDRKKAESDRIEYVSSLMRDLRRTGIEKEGIGSDYDRYAIGLARDFLNMKPSSSTPNPFDSDYDSIPKGVRDTIQSWFDSEAHGVFPLSTSGISPNEAIGETYAEARKRMRHYNGMKIKWMEDNMNKSDVVKNLIKNHLMKVDNGVPKWKSVMDSIQRSANGYSSRSKLIELAVEKGMTEEDIIQDMKLMQEHSVAVYRLIEQAMRK